MGTSKSRLDWENKGIKVSCYSGCGVGWGKSLEQAGGLGFPPSGKGVSSCTSFLPKCGVTGKRESAIKVKNGVRLYC